MRKTTILLGLLTLSTAQQSIADNTYIYRHGLQGVIKEYKEPSNEEMCLNQEQQLSQVSNVGICYQHDGFIMDVNSSTNRKYYPDFMPRQEGYTFSLNGEDYILGKSIRYHYTQKNGICNAVSTELFASTKTQNYDWCIENGFETKN